MTRTFRARSRHVLEVSEHFLVYSAAVVAGVILMVTGLALGVTIVMLPVGLPVGIVGVLLFLWGLVGHGKADGHDVVK